VNRCVTVLSAASVMALTAGIAGAGVFTPAAVTDQTPDAPLANPTPANFQPRYMSGFGSNDTFTVFFEDRDHGSAISFVSTTTGPTGLSSNATPTGITNTHFCVKDWPINIGGTNYNYRGWGSVGNNADHDFYVATDLTNWTWISRFTVTNAPGYDTSGYTTYYGFHDVIKLNGTYYAWGEGSGGQTFVLRSANGDDGWEQFASVGGSSPTHGPLQMPESPTPSGAFVDLGIGRGYGKLHVRGSDEGFYLAVNSAARANLPAAELEAAFTNVANWTWNDGSTGIATNATAILEATAEHDVRECWVVPNTEPADDWVIVYDADYGAGDGGKALGYATLTPPPPPPVHNVTKDLYYTNIQVAVDAADAGNRIEVAAGTYALFTIDKELVIHGAGTSANPASGTIIDSGTTLPAATIWAGGSSTTNRCVLGNMRLTGATATQTEGSGIEIEAGTLSHVTITNVVCTGNNGQGIALDGSSFSDILVVDCTLSTNNESGVRLPSTAVVVDFTIQNCIVAGNRWAGLTGYSVTTNLVIRNSQFSGNASNANSYADIVFSGWNGDAQFRDITLTGNHAQGGIRLTGSHVSKIPTGPMGTVSLTNVTIQGTYSHAALQISRYTNSPAMPVSFNNVQLNSDSPCGLHLGTVHGQMRIAGITFNGANASGNIVLGKHGAGYVPPSTTYPDATVAVDATGATFTGAADNYAIEDRVYHALDNAALGLVTWVANNVYVTPNSGSVGRGVQAVGAGDTVNVQDGTYTQTVTTAIGSAMALRSETGDQQTSSAIITGTNGLFTIPDGVSDVTIQGFRFENVSGQAAIQAAAPATGQNNVVVRSNRFVNCTHAAIDASSNAGPNTRTNWLVAANRIDGVTDYPNSGLRFMVLQTSAIRENLIRNIAYNGMTLEGLDSVLVADNTISNVYASGIQVANSSGIPMDSTNVTLTANRITNANTNDSSDKGGIAVYPDVAGIAVVSNTLSENNNGFAVRDKTPAMSAGVRLNNNNIAGNTGYGAANFAQGGGTLNATDNWWGSYAGPGAVDGGGRTGDAVTSNVQYSAWTYGEYGKNFDADAFMDPVDTDDENDTLGDVAEVGAGSDPLDPDTDADQMPDAWEVGYGLDPVSPADATLDPDTDGSDNRSEYAANTHPGIGSSRLRIAAFTNQPGVAEISFPCSDERVYTLEYRAELGQGAWNPIPGLSNVVGEADGYMTMLYSNAPATGFYRVRAALPAP